MISYDFTVLHEVQLNSNLMLVAIILIHAIRTHMFDDFTLMCWRNFENYRLLIL